MIKLDTIILRLVTETSNLCKHVLTRGNGLYIVDKAVWIIGRAGDEKTCVAVDFRSHLLHICAPSRVVVVDLVEKKTCVTRICLTLDRQMHQLSEILLKMIKIQIFKVKNIDISHL